MINRFISFILAFVFVFTLSFSTFADNTSITTFSWSDAADIINDVFADSSSYWLVEEVDAVFWLPNFFISKELTEEDRDNKCVGCFVSNSGNAFIYITYSDDGITLDSFYNALSQSGYDVEMVSVNEIPAIIFRNAENDSMFLIYQTQQGKLFQIMFTGYLDENLPTIYDLVISSIQPRVEEVSEEPVSSDNPVSGLISK